MRFCGKGSECYARYLAAYRASRIVTVSQLSGAAARFSLAESECYHSGKAASHAAFLFPLHGNRR